jgi:predicted ABC-type ATPase
MIGGPNGSGKSTLIELLQAQGADFGDHFNADVIAKELGVADEQTGRKAQEMVRSLRDQALAARVDYSWETVMSHHSHIDHLLEARSVGYEVSLVYVATEDPAVSIGRVRDRVAQGGHDVPVARIRSRYQRSLEQLPRAVLISHHARIIDNSRLDQPYIEIASLNGDWFEALPSDQLPLWFRPALAEISRHKA